MRVVVTGSAGRLARTVVPRLLAEPAVESVVGIDRRPSGLDHPKLTEHHRDIRSPELGELLRDVDCLVHMAFVVFGRRRHRTETRSVNVDGSIAVFQRAIAARVRQIVFVSSAAVYGPGPDTPVPATEDAPLQPIPGFGYAEDKAAVERWLAAEVRGRLAVLRPHVILGRHAHPVLRVLLKLPFYPRLPEPAPRLQCIWEDDVAEAVARCLDRQATGTFNLAAEPAMSFRQMQTLRHRHPAALPLGLIGALQGAAALATPAAGERGWVHGLRYPLVLDCTRAHAELDWAPRHSVPECVLRMRSM